MQAFNLNNVVIYKSMLIPLRKKKINANSLHVNSTYQFCHFFLKFPN